MSEKKLLNENTIRRFMKLANVGPLTNNFIAENYEEEVVEEAAEEEMPEDEEMPEGEEIPEDEELEMELGDEDGEVMGEADISLTEEEAQLLIDLGDRLRDAMGPEEPEMEEPEMEEPETEEPETEEPIGAEEPEPEAPEDDLIQEVLRRVTKRLIRERTRR